MTESTVLAGDSFAAQVRDGVIWITWDKDATVTDHKAAALAGRVDALSPGVCPPMLVVLNGMVSLSRGALKTFSNELNIAAMALVGPSAVDRMLVSYFTEVHNPPYPTRHFGDVDDALMWLTEHPHAK